MEAPASTESRGPRHHRKGHHPDGRPDRDRPDRAAERPQQARQADEKPRPPPRERREKAPDPNSPFAKLAALKAQLEANAKERR